MRERLHSDERGFTLLELLVSVVILSTLLAIASGYYYHQRRKGWVAQVHSSLRNMASAENNHVYSGGALAYSTDLDDLWNQGYRYSTDTVIPHVALATSLNFCIQVNSAYDPSIVWHFSSEVGYPQEGPATATACGDIDGTGTYVTQGTGQRDGFTSSGVEVASPDPGVPGDASRTGNGTPTGTSTTTSDTGTTTGGTDTYGGIDSSGGTTTTDSGGTSTGSTGGSGTTDTTTGTTPTDGANDGGSNGAKGKGNESSKNDGSCKAKNDPDGDSNGGSDSPGGTGGIDTNDQDCNNGSGNDSDGEDDNNGGGKKN